MLFKAAFYPHVRKKLDRSANGGKLYQIFVEKDAQFKPSQYNNLFDSLYTIYDPNKPYDWISMEYHSTVAGIGLYCWCSGGVSREFLQSNINSIHPSAEIEPTQDYAAVGKHFGKDIAVATLELDSHYLFPLAQCDGERVGADVMASLCASMENLGDREQVAVQFLLRPVHYRALTIARSYYEHYKKFGKRPNRLHFPFARLNPYLEVPKALLEATKHAIMGSAGSKEDTDNIAPIRRKIEAGIYFDLLIRIVAISDVFGRSKERLQTVVSSFSPLTDKNRLRPYGAWNREKFLRDFEQRRIHTYPLENYVSPAELATMLHFPDKNIPGVIRLRSKKMPVPEGVIKYNSIEEAWKDGAVVFGLSNFRGKRKYLAFRDVKMLMQHAYIIGATGSGKSYLLTFLALQVARHAGITFFDVKGDVVDMFLQFLPPEDWKRVVYIDLHDKEWFIPFNILRQPGMSVYNLSTMIVGVFVKVFSDGSIKEHSQNILRMALIAVIATDPEGSLLEVYRMFTDEPYLDRAIKNLQNREFPDVLDYWKNNYKKMKPSQRKSEAGAILNKLQTITQNERPRYTLSQRENILKWRKLMDTKAIILVNLSMGQNEDEILNFFGTLFTAFISRATFSRDNIKEEKRVPHVFILDEFERFVQQDADMKKFLEMARSYRLGLMLSHQSVKQIPGDLLGMIEDNTFTQITLNIGTGSSQKIAKMFPSVCEEDLTGLDVWQGFARFKKLHPDPFTFETLNIGEFFPAVDEKAVKKFKSEFKQKYYKHELQIKEEINERYRLVEQNLVTEDSNPAAQKGNASGRIQRRRHSTDQLFDHIEIITRAAALADHFFNERQKPDGEDDAETDHQV